MAAPAPFLKDYALCERLGQGSFGEVFKAHRKTGPRKTAAIKVISRANISKSGNDNLITEISLMKRLRHPHIVDLIDFRWDRNYIYIIMEYCGGGDLSRFLKKKTRLPESVCQRFLQQVALAMQYLHENKVAHMDLKPGNLLLTSIGKNPVVKMADFGFATHLTEDKERSSIIGSPLYMAPEILDRKYDANKVDLWSIGIILYECLFGRTPFKSDTREEVFSKLRQPEPITVPRRAGISAHCWDLLSRCLERDPEKRIGFEAFFQHPFLDLEHAPSTESEAKADRLVEKAVEKEKSGDVEAALDLYKDALNYLVPLVKSSSVRSSLSLRQKTVQYMEKAEELKGVGNSSSSSSSSIVGRKEVSRLQQRSSTERSKYEDLLERSRVTPRMQTGLEIARAGEDYEVERKYKIALEKYKAGLDILMPLLGSEPAGPRQKLLSSEVSRWLGRAEAAEKLMAIQEEVLATRMLSASETQEAEEAEEEKASKTCKLQ